MNAAYSSSLNRRGLLIGAALMGIGGVAIARQPKPGMAPVRKDALDRLVPRQIGDWSYHDSSGLVLPPPDALSDALYSGLVTRTYVAADRLPIMLLVAYSNVQNGMLQLHRPEICYPAGGYRLSPTQVEDVPDGLGGAISSNNFSADGTSRIEQVLYWTRIGKLFPTSWLQQRLAVVRANIDGKIPDGVLVRISTLAPDMNAAQPDLAAFAAQLIKSSSPGARRLLIGEP